MISLFCQAVINRPKCLVAMGVILFVLGFSWFSGGPIRAALAEGVNDPCPQGVSTVEFKFNDKADTSKATQLNLKALNLRLKCDFLPGDPKVGVVGIWRILLGATDILVAIYLIAIAIATIFHIQYDTYSIKKTLPPLIVGIILANFSLFIVRFLVDFATVLTATFINAEGGKEQFLDALIRGIFRQGAGAIGGFVSSPTGNAISWLLTIIGFVVGVSAVATGGISLAGFGIFLGALTVIGIIAILIPTILILVLALLLYARYYVVLLLAVLAPLAFISMAFPPTQQLFRRWWSEMIRWTFMLPVIFFLLWLAIRFGGLTGTEANFATYFITLVFMYLAIKVPFSWGTLMGAGVTAGVYGLTKTLGKRLGSSAWEGYGYRMAKASTAQPKMLAGESISQYNARLSLLKKGRPVASLLQRHRTELSGYAGLLTSTRMPGETDAAWRNRRRLNLRAAIGLRNTLSQEDQRVIKNLSNQELGLLAQRGGETPAQHASRISGYAAPAARYQSTYGLLQDLGQHSLYGAKDALKERGEYKKAFAMKYFRRGRYYQPLVGRGAAYRFHQRDDADYYQNINEVRQLLEDMTGNNELNLNPKQIREILTSRPEDVEKYLQTSGFTPRKLADLVLGFRRYQFLTGIRGRRRDVITELERRGLADTKLTSENIGRFARISPHAAEEASGFSGGEPSSKSLIQEVTETVQGAAKQQPGFPNLDTLRVQNLAVSRLTLPNVLIKAQEIVEGNQQKVRLALQQAGVADPGQQESEISAISNAIRESARKNQPVDVESLAKNIGVSAQVIEAAVKDYDASIRARDSIALKLGPQHFGLNEIFPLLGHLLNELRNGNLDLEQLKGAVQAIRSQ